MNESLIVAAVKGKLNRKGVEAVLRTLLAKPCKRADLEPACATNYAPNQLKCLRDAGLDIGDDYVRLGRSSVKQYYLTAEARSIAIKALGGA
ncbi:MAG: hypothetical protein ACRCV6_00475 [Formosimonas sp.]